MPFGLFGKVPQKRDFLAINLPDAILHPFETWLQTSLAASRGAIGRRWEEFYLVAPIWRFWIGPGIFGAGCAGAMAPSVDAVGRFFPLAIVHWDGAAGTAPPPLLDPAEGWYGAIDKRLLQVLAETGPDYLETLLDGLEAPPSSAVPDAGRTTGIFRDGLALAPADGDTLLESLPALRDVDYAAAAVGRSYWWCKAPSGLMLHAGAGLPEPDRFARMLLWTG